MNEQSADTSDRGFPGHRARAEQLAAEFAVLAASELDQPSDEAASRARRLGFDALNLAADIKAAANPKHPRNQPKREPLHDRGINFYEGLPIGLIAPREHDPAQTIIEVTIVGSRGLGVDKRLVRLTHDQAYVLGVLMVYGHQPLSGAQIKGLGFRQRPRKSGTNQAFGIAMTSLNCVFEGLSRMEDMDLVLASGTGPGKCYWLNPNVRFVLPADETEVGKTAVVAPSPLETVSLVENNAKLMSPAEVLAWLQTQLPDEEVSMAELMDLIMADDMIKPVGDRYSYYARHRALKALAGSRGLSLD